MYSLEAVTNDPTKNCFRREAKWSWKTRSRKRFSKWTKKWSSKKSVEKTFFQVKQSLEVKLGKKCSGKHFRSDESEAGKACSETKWSKAKQGFQGNNFALKHASLLHRPHLNDTEVISYYSMLIYARRKSMRLTLSYVRSKQSGSVIDSWSMFRHDWQTHPK